MPAALSLLSRPLRPSLAPARSSRAATAPVVVTRALFGKNRQVQEAVEQQQQLPPAPVRRSGGRNNARRSSPQQLVAAPGSSHAPSLSQRYESAPPLARGLIGAAAALVLFAVLKKILVGGR